MSHYALKRVIEGGEGGRRRDSWLRRAGCSAREGKLEVGGGSAMRAQGGGERREGRGKWAAGGVGSEEGVGRRKRTGPSEWLGQGGLK
jgi:hypothetical protein